MPYARRRTFRRSRRPRGGSLFRGSFRRATQFRLRDLQRTPLTGDGKWRALWIVEHAPRSATGSDMLRLGGLKYTVRYQTNSNDNDGAITFTAGLLKLNQYEGTEFATLPKEIEQDMMIRRIFAKETWIDESLSTVPSILVQRSVRGQIPLSPGQGLFFVLNAKLWGTAPASSHLNVRFEWSQGGRAVPIE